MKRTYIITIFIFMISNIFIGQKRQLRLGVIGLSHGHVGWILGREDANDVTMVGIVETDMELAKRLSSEYNFSMDLVFGTIEEMIAAKNPEAVEITSLLLLIDNHKHL